MGQYGHFNLRTRQRGGEERRAGTGCYTVWFVSINRPYQLFWLINLVRFIQLPIF